MRILPFKAEPPDGVHGEQPDITGEYWTEVRPVGVHGDNGDILTAFATRARRMSCIALMSSQGWQPQTTQAKD